MDDTPTNGDGRNNNVISFPDGKKISPEEIGAPFVVTSVGHMTVSEPVDSVVVSEELRERENYVRGQELVKVVESGGSTSEVVDILLKEIAEEISHLKWDRKKAAMDGKPTVGINLARISGLKGMTEILLKRKESALAERLDLRSERFQKIFQVIMESFSESMEKVGVSHKEIDLVFQQMRADMLELEKKLEATG